MNLTITASNPTELKVKLVELAKVFGYVPEQMELPLSSPAAEANTAPAPAKRTRKSAQKEETSPLNGAHAAPAPATTPSNDIFDDKPAAKATTAPAPTKDMVVEALKQVNAAKGIEVAREVLAEFQCSRVSELKEENFGEFIDACSVAMTAANA